MMRISHIDEPELEFGTGKHVDIRFGLRNYGPLDYKEKSSPKQLNVGIIGTSETIDGVSRWLEVCRTGIASKPSRQPHLFSDFPGFDADRNLYAKAYTSDVLQSALQSNFFKQLKEAKNAKLAVERAVDAFLVEIEALSAKNVHVVVCALPSELIQAMEIEDTQEGNTEDITPKQSERAADFHDLLKARAMRWGKPIQILLPSTYDESKRSPQKRRKWRLRTNQDAATRAWNFHVALYYKAGGVPWRLIRRLDAYVACYVGVSFYQTLDKENLLASVAQVFNERGEGMVIRGSAAFRDKDDLQIHLPEDGAFNLLSRCLKAYDLEHHHMPARVVLHKSSEFDDAERAGFRRAADGSHVRSLDLVSLGDSGVRLFRTAPYPPLRGTLLHLDEYLSVLYTRGSVPFFETYPGMYIPQALGIRLAETESSADSLAEEILSLTKMNWNNTQFDGSEPITLTAARKVGRILKYLGENDTVQSRYSFYM